MSTWPTVLPTLLAFLDTAQRVGLIDIDTNGDGKIDEQILGIADDLLIRGRTAAILAREYYARLYSPIPSRVYYDGNARVFRDLLNDLVKGQSGGGPGHARYYIGALANAPPISSVFLDASQPPISPLLTMPELLAAADQLIADQAAVQVDSIATDVGMAATIASTLAATRASYLSELQSLDPQRGYA